MRNRKFVFAPKIEYKLVAESAEKADKLREANHVNLTFKHRYAILVSLSGSQETDNLRGNSAVENAVP